MLTSNSALRLIDKPTRVTDLSATILDDVITNNISNVVHLCIFLSDLSDHYPVACIVSGKPSKKKQPKTYIKYRDMRHFVSESFTKDLNNSLGDLFNNVSLSINEIDNCFTNLVQRLTECINRHAPIKIASRKTQ